MPRNQPSGSCDKSKRQQGNDVSRGESPKTAWCHLPRQRKRDQGGAEPGGEGVADGFRSSHLSKDGYPECGDLQEAKQQEHDQKLGDPHDQ